MLITLIGLVLVVATAAALAWPLLSEPERDLVDALAPDPRARLTSEKEAALAAIREADFDHETGKLSAEDYATLRAELEERALRAITALDRATEPASSPREAAIGTAPAAGAFCSSCGVPMRGDATFCSHCGQQLARSRSGKRRRRA
jgi:cytochrome c-type biogenesis protein CcmI